MAFPVLLRRCLRPAVAGGLSAAVVLGFAGCASVPDPGGGGAAGGPGAGGVVLDNLMVAELAGAAGTEVVVSRVTIPPDTSLPKHWHPGEEFAYVMDGSVTLWQEGKPDVAFEKGDVAKVPLKQVHTAVTGDEGVELLIFRVHEKGKPERVLVEGE